MGQDIHTLRNIGIIAHIDAGKTTLTERMLFYSGRLHRVGSVDEGTTETDFDVEERQRGITIYSACVSFYWKGMQINLIDTPGHVDFTAEVERSLRVLDGGVVVFSAREGVEAQSETVWHQADKYHVPRIAFINKMDREGADFFGTVKEIEERLEAQPLPITLPIGCGPSHMSDPFRAVIDLIEMKALRFLPENDGRQIVQEEIPSAVEEEAQFWRAHLLDRLSHYSDEIIELLLADQPVPADLIRRVLRQATIHHRIVPVLCGSALDGIGVQPVMDAVVDYLPSPADLPPVEGMDPEKKDRKLTRKPDPKEPFCGLVFKVVADRHGDMFWVRVYSGQLKANSRVLNPGKNKRENVPQLWRIQADDREQIQMAEAGDIVGLIGLHHSTTGDTLCDPRHPILLESIRFPETVISMAVEPENAIERKKLAQVLEMLKRQDPTFRAQENEETGQTLISGMGELHLEIIKHRLIRDFKLNVRVHKPKVSYRETIEKAVEVTGQCHRQWGGQNLFAEVTIRMEPTPIGQGSGQVEVLAASADVLPAEFLAAVLEELQQQALGGGSLGFPLLHVRITVLSGQVHPTDSNETAFRMAANDAFHKALRQAGVVLLEPIMRVEVAVPDEYVGDIVSDLQQRRAVITRTHPRGRNITVIEARAPLANLFGYSNAMRGLSQGRASCSLEPCAYGPAPPEVVQTFLL